MNAREGVGGTTALPLIMSKLVSEAKEEGSKSKIAGCKSEARSINPKTYKQH